MSSSEWSTTSSFTTKQSYTASNEQAKLLASNGVAGDRLGYSIAMNGNGDTVIVGAYAADPVGYLQAGSAYVYVRSGATWTQQAILIASDKANNDYFGYSVAMSADGNTAVIGACQDDTNKGSAYVFIRIGTSWYQQDKLVDSTGLSNYYFGCSVSISADGNTAIVGAYADSTVATSAGSVCFFTRSGSSWSRVDKVYASDAAASDLFGISVCISGDASTVVVGAYLNDDDGTSSGSAYIFTKPSTQWTQQAKLLASDAADSDNFGRSVSISNDGNTAVISAFLDDTTFTDAGSAYIFTRSGSTWSQYTKITPTTPVLEHWFGGCISINGNGDTILIGANGDDTKGTNAGAVFIFTKTAGVWSQQAKLTASDTATVDYFGYSVSSSADGAFVAVGTVYDDDKGSNAGAAYIFS